jgi:hypothetical protein
VNVIAKYLQKQEQHESATMTSSTESNSDLLDAIDKIVDGHDNSILKDLNCDRNMAELREAKNHKKQKSLIKAPRRDHESATMTTSTKNDSELLDAIDEIIDKHDSISIKDSEKCNVIYDRNMVEMRKLILQCCEMELRINTLVLENNKKYSRLVQLYITAVEKRVRNIMQ